MPIHDGYTPFDGGGGGAGGGGGTPVSVTKKTYKTVLAGALAEMDPWQVGVGSPIITVAHGLVRQPDFYETYIECVVATSSDGYSMGDRIPNVHTPWRITVRSDDTNTYLISSNSGNRFGISDLDAGRNSDDFTANQWKFAAAPYIFVDTEVVTGVTGGGVNNPTIEIWGFGQTARLEEATVGTRVFKDASIMFAKWNADSDRLLFGATEDMIDVLTEVEATALVGADERPDASSRDGIYLKFAAGTWDFRVFGETVVSTLSNPQLRLFKLDAAAMDGVLAASDIADQPAAAGGLGEPDILQPVDIDAPLIDVAEADVYFLAYVGAAFDAVSSFTAHGLIGRKVS